ncbi:ABC transporter permease subunit [Alienimonas californiensis]|uniref:Phosphate transport system permease protein PstC n=1 Tax=Alienimonas californiensis TaxID=2527989 RepID=A0A517PBQ8_9PLAN|nr:ABC transporter permease subunit [Alienimonas californiensis]QDT16814.1 Phosphate transport system permease protein PstC [Alienimonas californiensis]
MTQSAPAAGASFTGRRRNRKTKASVRWADRIASGLISVGGIGTILAIFGVGLVLVWQVVPLFLPGELETPTTLTGGATPRTATADAPVIEPADGVIPTDGTGDAGTAGVAAAGGPAANPGAPDRFAVDEFAVAAATVAADGTVVALDARTGQRLGSKRLSEQAPTAVTAAPDGAMVAVGYADGTIRLGQMRFDSAFRSAEALPAAVRTLGEGETAPVPTEDDAAVAAVAEATRGGRFRVQTVIAALDEEVYSLGEGPVRALGVYESRSGPAVAGWVEGEGLKFLPFRRSGSTLTPRDVAALQIPAGADVPDGSPAFVRIGARASEALAAWPDGRAVRFNTRNARSPQFSEALRLVEAGRTLTALEWAVGRGTLLVGDDAGVTTGWFPSRGDAAGGARSLTAAKRYPDGPAGVTAIGPSPVDRLAAIGYADGTARVIQTTVENVVGETELDGPASAVTITPRSDRSFLYALSAAAGPQGSDAGLSRAAFDAGAADATLASLFLPVWYEGGPGPEAKWQSTSSGVGFEPKYGMWPLIFGTLKATFYSMLFAAPLGILAAIYTGEYLTKPVRAKVKPAVEVMAGLPSVVLGFLAAVAFAPFVERYLVSALCGFVTVPVAVLLGAYIWEALPQPFTLRYRRWRLAACAVCLPLGVWAAHAAAPVVEELLFAGDVKFWLDGRIGTPVGAWMFLTLPLAVLAVGLGSAYGATPKLVRRARGWKRGRFAWLRVGTFLGSVALTLGLAWGVAWGLSAAGELLAGSPWDPRGEIVDTYQQRNAVVVGFAMAFTIIPIVYTLADDALSSVPDSLRSASLGAGATTWQTTVRVVVPAAMSGLFSALMVGLGRAVGETMIVLMAAGGTAITEVNPFNGFRTLAVNIATEIPEAARGTTHYRTLFLAALLLFGMTFIVNTAAETVRLRFRKRVSQI